MGDSDLLIVPKGMTVSTKRCTESGGNITTISWSANQDFSILDIFLKILTVCVLEPLSFASKLCEDLRRRLMPMTKVKDEWNEEVWQLSQGEAEQLKSENEDLKNELRVVISERDELKRQLKVVADRYDPRWKRMEE